MFQLLEIPVELMENPVPSCGHYSGLAALPAGLPSAQAPLSKNGEEHVSDFVSQPLLSLTCVIASGFILDIFHKQVKTWVPCGWSQITQDQECPDKQTRGNKVMLPGREGGEYKDAQEGQKRRYVGCSKKGVTEGALSDHVV